MMTDKPVDTVAADTTVKTPDPSKTNVALDTTAFGNPKVDESVKVQQQQVKAVTHTAAPGETLKYIAELYYPGSVNDNVVRGLWRANVNRLRDIDALTVGTNLIIPVYDPDWNNPDYWEVKDEVKSQAFWSGKNNTPPAL